MDLLMRIEITEAEVRVWDVEGEELRVYRRVEDGDGVKKKSTRKKTAKKKKLKIEN